MKQRNWFIVLGIVLVSCVVITVYLTKSNSFRHTKTHPMESQASEGTREDPLARVRYNWLKLRDPSTNQIPKHIRTRERAFMKRSMAKLNGQYHAVTNDHNWMARGPYHIGGRTKALAIDVTNENIILAGGVSSGMWKSIDGGTSWRKTTAPDQIHSVSCIAQNTAPGKEYIWYYGTGEGDIRGGSAAGPLGTNAFYNGDGIFKSVDGGDSWSQIPSTVSGTADEKDPFDFIWKIVAYGEDTVFAATSTGLHKSTDGGNSWDHYLDFGDNEPIDTYPSTEIAVTGQGICYATIGGNGPDNGIYRSVDGELWQNISPPDWPDTTTRTVISVAPSNENIVYFFTCEKYETTRLRKYKDGVGWTDLTVNLPSGGEFSTYSGKMLIVYVKPDDENTIFVGAIALYRSMDGGQSFEPIGSYGDFHVDQQAIVFYPSDPKAMIVGNDGGLYRTNNNIAETIFDPYGGYTIEWESLNNGYLTTQFYSIAVDHETPNSETILGGMQDNAWMFTKSSYPESTAVNIFAGAVDGGFTAISDSGEFYYGNQGATFTLWRHAYPDGEHQFTNITPASAAGMGLWLEPFILDPHDTNIMYFTSRNELWRNSDLTEIPFTFPSYPTDVNWDQLENVVPDNYISALGMSEAEPRRLYYGTWHGELYRIDNPHEGQPVPMEITNETLPIFGYIHCIAVDPINPDKVIVVYPNYGIISIHASEDGGETWMPVSGNLEEVYKGTGCGPSVRWVEILYVEDKPVYFAGTSVGLFSTTKLDSMNTTWVQEGPLTIGCVVVDMIDVRQSDGFVAVGTHGNGVYSTFVTEWPSDVEANADYLEDFKLFDVYPNPFNLTTTIRFTLPKSGRVKLKVYNLLGEEISTIIDGYRSQGENQIQWTASKLSSGMYIIRLSCDYLHMTEKVLLIK